MLHLHSDLTRKFGSRDSDRKRELTTISRQISRSAMKRPLTPPSSRDSGSNKGRCVITISSGSKNDAEDSLEELPSIHEILNTPRSNCSELGESSLGTIATSGDVKHAPKASSETSRNSQPNPTTPRISRSLETHTAFKNKRVECLECDPSSMRVRSQRARPQLVSSTARASISPKFALPTCDDAVYPEIPETDSELSSCPPKTRDKVSQGHFSSPTVGHRFITSPKRFKGLANEGQLCYRNALLQLLFGIPEFANVLDDFEHRNECGTDHCLICRLSGVRRAVQGLDQRNVSKLNAKFTNECFERGWASGRGGRRQQQDAIDFLEWLLGQLLLDIL